MLAEIKLTHVIQSQLAIEQLEIVTKIPLARRTAIRASKKSSPRLYRKTPLHRRSEIRNVEETRSMVCCP
jgi:hypothetical protein